MEMLDEKVLQELRDTQAKLNAEGKLPSRTQLAAYYDTFRRRFGPERLASLDGEALLETMHAHGNRDSLVYWLEFKDDEESPAMFGSIAGGSGHGSSPAGRATFSLAEPQVRRPRFLLVQARSPCFHESLQQM